MNLSENYTKSTRRYVVDWNLLPFQELPLEKFGRREYVKEYVEMFATGNVNCIFQYVKDMSGYSVYPSKLGPMFPQLGYDFLAELVQCAHARDIRVSAYYNVGLDRAAVAKHPDWSTRNLEGNGCGFFTWDESYICLNSPYRQYALEQIIEIAEHDIDMMFVDIMEQGDAGAPGCYCDYCRDAYRQQLGKEMPTVANWDRDWRQLVSWRLDVVEQYWEEIVAAVQAQKPGLPVSKNTYGWSHRANGVRRVKGEQFLDAEDGGDGEEGGAENRSTTHVCTFLRGLTGRKAFHFSANTDFWGVQDWPSQHRYRHRAMSVLTQGGVSTLGDNQSPFLADGTLVRENFRRLGVAFEERALKEPYIEGATSIPYLGVVYSDSTKLFYGREDIAGRCSAPFQGALSAAFGLHIPVDVIPEWELESDAASEFRVLLLANTAAISARQADGLRQYVADGGTLLACYETSLYDEWGDLLDDFQLADVFGLKYLGCSNDDPEIVYHNMQGRDNTNGYIDGTGEGIFAGLPESSIRLPGAYLRTQATAGKTLAFYRDPVVIERDGKPWSWGPMPGKETDYPAIHQNRYGRGSAVFIGSQIFNACSTFGAPERRNCWWVRKLTENILELLAPNPPMRVQAPHTVDVTFWDHPEKQQIIVQLFNKTDWDTVIPIDNITIRISKDVAQLQEAYLPCPDRKMLDITDRGEWAEITLPRLDLHEIVFLETVNHVAERKSG